MNFRLTIAASALVVLPLMSLSAASARDLVVVTFGGTTADIQKLAFTDPYVKKTGKNVTAVAYNGEQAKIKAMVETKNVQWDLVEVEPEVVVRGCGEGLYEVVDWKTVVNTADLVPNSVTRCAVGTFISATVLAYNTSTVKPAPKGWADFWNVKKYPGKRGLRKSALTNLEYALIADGVQAKDVYKVLATPEGVDRAFKKLDELKPYIQWWEAGAQPIQMLAAGDVVMSSVYNGRVGPARKQGYPLAISWDGSLYEVDYWVIPKGTPKKAEALDFIKLASSPQSQKLFAENVDYGPISKTALKELDPKILADLPNSPANTKNAELIDANFWADHGEELEQRFSAWVAR